MANKEKFRVRFKNQFGNKGRILKEIIFDTDDLKEGETKPDRVFQWRKGSYLYNKIAVVDYDFDGLPIYEYYVGNMLPIVEQWKFPLFMDAEGKEVTINNELFDKVISRGEAKTAIASMQKEPSKFEWLPFIMGITVGAAIGLMAMFFAYPHLGLALH